MGQCVSRRGVGTYAPIVSTDTISIASGVQPRCNGTRSTRNKGHSESKGAKKRSTTRGVATSFGFRKRPASSSRIPNKVSTNYSVDSTDGAEFDVTRRRSRTPNSLDKNGNGGSPVTSGRSTPLARPRKEVAGAPLRTNRFGFRQTGPPKTAKVCDVNQTIEHAFNFTQKEKEEEIFNITAKEKESKINNNPSDKSTNHIAIQPLVPTQICSGDTTRVSPNHPVRTTTKQTVILTYTTQQYTTNPNITQRRSVGTNRASDFNNINPRSKSVGRTYPTTGNQSHITQRPFEIGKYTLQTTQLPKPQLPSLTVLDSKTAKQVANNSRKVYGSGDYSNKSGTAVNTTPLNKYENIREPSNIDVQMEDASAQSKPRRPRNLEMVMRNAHSFHLRELQVTDLDILDEAVITDSGVIPLPKLPSALPDNEEVQYTASKAFADWQASRANDAGKRIDIQQIVDNTSINRIEELQNRLSAVDIHLRNNWMGEEKGNRDKIQHEKKKMFMNAGAVLPPRAPSPLTRSSSKESSPSSRSEEITQDQNVSSFSGAAGEAMAGRSQDDISTELSLSSCDDERPKPMSNSNNVPVVPLATISIVDSTLSSISRPVTYLENFSSQIILPSMLLSTSTLSGSTFSNTSGTMTNLASNSVGYMMDSAKFDLAALETSTHSMIDDETSPVDSLLSSSSDSNNDLVNIEDRDHLSVSSSAYQTANTKSKSANAIECTDINIDEEAIDILLEANDSPKKSKDVSPLTPGTPTNASNSLSLSDGRDFLIDDEIADQPGLIFENNSSADRATPSKEQEDRDRLPSPKKFNNSSPLLQLKKKGPARTPSLDTLSSIGSDDLMMDLELGRSITSLQSGDDYQEKMDGSLRSNLNSLDDAQLRQEFLNELSANKYSALKHWNHLLDQNTQLDKQLAAMGHHVNSNSTSNSSIANIGASLPARTARLLSRSRLDSSEASRAGSEASSVCGGNASAGGRTPRPPAVVSAGDRDLRLDRQSHAAMLQDVVAIKTLLIKLKRVLQEPEEDISLSTETLDPLSSETTQSNGLFLRLAESEGCDGGDEGRGEDKTIPTTPAHHREELADLRRQIVFLQSQLEDRERVVKHLQEQMNKCSESSDSSRTNGHSTEETCNVATQTERLRPLSTGPNILQNMSDGHTGIVSWSEHRKTISETPSIQPRIKKPPGRAFGQSNNNDNVVQCQCVVKKLNGFYANGHSDVDIDNKVSRINSMDNINQIKANGRVGSRYLQAIAGKQINAMRYVKKEGSGDKSLRSRSLFGCRSKSIENVNNNNYLSLSASNGNLSKKIDGNRGDDSSSGSNEGGDSPEGAPADAGERGPKATNGQSTDTDDNSDGGYKSLPPCLSSVRRNVPSGIPRRADVKFLSARSSRIY